MARVRLTNVGKVYPNGTTAVRGMNLEIRQGEFLCVLGPSGCGKSTTLRMIAGLEDVSSGIIEIDGENVVGMPSRERDIAMVFENYALYPHLNVFDNIAMPLVARRTSKPEIRERIREISGSLGITEHLRKRPSRLSGGQRQRVALARAMIRRPKMFLMDEPLGHLEEYLRIELRREIRSLHEATGGTTFYITHDQEEAAAVSDRIAVMYQGEIQQTGTMADLIERPANRFVAEFVGEPPINVFEKISVLEGSLEIGDCRIPLNHALSDACRSQPPRSAGVRPARLSVAGPESDGLSAVARSVQPMGEWGAILCETPAGEATAVVPSAALPSQNARIKLVVDPDHLHLFDAEARNIRFAGD